MRYRPFGASGKAVSAVSLLLRDAPNMSSPGAWRSLVISAMESGVNSFEATAGSDVLALGLGEALGAVERRLIFLGWRLRRYAFTGGSATYMRGWSNRVLELHRFALTDLTEAA